MNELTVQPASRIGSLQPYTPPLRDSRINLTLDNNEGSAIDASVLESIKNLDPEALTRYPDSSELERSIAQRLNVKESRVIITNGGDDAIDRICRAILTEGDTLLTNTPSFVMIPRYAQLAGARVNQIDWLEGMFPLQNMLDAIDERTKLIALTCPNNPTGAIIKTEEILAIASKAFLVGAVVLLDQAYIEFAEEDPIKEILDLPNIVIVRTFSKAMGLAGLRVGYAIGQVQMITWLRTVGGPYPVSVISLKIAQRAFECSSDRDPIIARTIAHRTELGDSLASHGFRVLPSQANFVLVRFNDAAGIHAALMKNGVSVRRFSTGGNIESYLRITVPADPRQQSQLLKVFDKIGGTS